MNTNNFTIISFPSLGIEWDPARAFQIGPLTVNMYGLIIAVGLMLAIFYGYKRCRSFGLVFDDCIDGILFIVPMAIVGARLYYCAFEWETYKDNLISILYIWNGGLAIYGGVIAAALGVWIFSVWKKVKIGAVLDVTSLGFLIGQSVGRWGNFFNREAFGAETDSFLRMGLYNSVSQLTKYYHPTFLYESVWNAVGFVLLHFISKKRKFDGQIALCYLAWYGLGRTFIEGLRMDSLYWGDTNIRVSQILAAVTCFCGVAALMMIGLFGKNDPADMQVNRLAAAEAEAADASAEEE